MRVPKSGRGGPPSGPGALNDSGVDLQHRVALFAKTMTYVLGVAAALGVVFNLANDRALLRLDDAPLVSVLTISGFGWLITSQPPVRTTAFNRAVDLGITLVGCALLAVAFPLTPVSGLDFPGIGVLLLWAASFFLGVFLSVRAAIVPSPWPLTAVVGGLVTVMFSAAGSRAWDLHPPVAGADPALTGALACGIVMATFTIVTSTISRITWGLRKRVREAVQLGQYTLGEKLGEGGMGEVYRATHAMLRRPTAVKLLPTDKSSPQAVRRFEREVQHTSALQHPNTVSIYDFGHTPDGVFYYAMEYLDGVPLDRLVDAEHRLPAGRVVHVLAQAAEALAEAHAAGLVHRDLKPGNLMLCHRAGIPDVVKVLDFGLVKDLTASEEASVTNAHTVMGTPHYMAPEAITDPAKVDARSDLYSMGALAYHLLTGRTVFEDRTVVGVCAQHVHRPPEPLIEHVDIEHALEELVLRCLAKDPNERPQSATELLRELRRCAASGQWSEEDAERWWSGKRAAAEVR